MTEILETYDTGQSYVGWCPRCKRWHWHGRIDGHRSAHCLDGRDGEYILRCIGPAPAWVQKDLGLYLKCSIDKSGLLPVLSCHVRVRRQIVEDIEMTVPWKKRQQIPDIQALDTQQGR